MVRTSVVVLTAAPADTGRFAPCQPAAARTQSRMPPAGALRLRDGRHPAIDPGKPSRPPPGRQGRSSGGALHLGALAPARSLDGGSMADGMTGQHAPTCLKDGVPEENTGPEGCKRRLTLDEPKAKRRPRFRWSASCQPGEELVARGGVEPPTFRFSGGRSYQLSYLAVLGSCYPCPGSGRCPRAANQDAARITHGVGAWRS
jgi:hypothetical protein